MPNITTNHAITYTYTIEYSRHFVNTVEPPLSASSPKRPLFFRPVYSPYIIALCLNLSTTATSLHAATTTSRALSSNAKITTSLQRPDFYGKSRTVMKFDLFGGLLINRGNSILIVFHLYCFSKHKLSTILIANVANLTRFVTLTF